MARSTTAGRMATLGTVFGILVGACATQLPAPSGPPGSASTAASPSVTPFPTLTATPESSPAPTTGMTHPRGVATSSRVYLVGLDTSGTRGRFGVYDARRHTWRLLQALPTAREDPAVALGPDRGLYVLGGRRVQCCAAGQGGGALATVERYDLKTDRWTRLGPMPYPSALAGAAMGDDTLFLFLPERVWSYDWSHDRWTAGPTSLTDGATGSPTRGEDGLIRVFACDHYDIWHPGDGHWQPGRAFTSPRCGAVAAAAGAQIMLFGGEYTGNEGRSLESIDSGGG